MNGQLKKILVVEDDPVFGRQLATLLEVSFEHRLAVSLEAAQECLAEEVFHGVLLDVRLGGRASADRDGLRLLDELRTERPLLPIIVMTAFSDVSLAVEALKRGANDFVDKRAIEPADLVRRLRDAIEASQRQLSLEATAAAHLQVEPSSLVGSSEAMDPVREIVAMASADGYCSVLILGETGTGKGVVAKSIHSQGWRSQGPWVEVPPAGLSGSLLDSELFGHERGAFTGANSSKVGYVERARDGVLFLDEIGDLSLELQVKLLRFLEDRVLFKVGSSKGRPVDVQVVAATHRPLKEYVQDGRFREDLFYRLRTVEITVPPLRDRAEDIPLLADHFLQQMRNQGRTRLAGFSSRVVDQLGSYHWPGNVRELRAAVEWAVLAAMRNGHSVIETSDVPEEIRAPKPSNEQSSEGEEGNVYREVARAELACVEKALRKVGGKKEAAQERLGYPNRQTMLRRLKKIRAEHGELWSRFPEVCRLYGFEGGGL